MRPRVLILHAPGTNRAVAAARACALAGGAPEVVSVEALLRGTREVREFQMMVLPGGFTYGDDLGAGRLWGEALRAGLGGELAGFVAAERPILGICNGFQALMAAGLLPGDGEAAGLAANASGRFECRWVELEPEPGSRSIFLRGLSGPIGCPVAHGEGRLVASSSAVAGWSSRGQIALRYRVPAGAKNVYPHNPNGSIENIAALTDDTGLVMGLMPHPEDAVTPAQRPAARRRAAGRLGLALFEQAMAWARRRV